MEKNTISRVFICSILIMAILFFGFIALILASFTASLFYSVLSIVITIALVIFVIIGGILSPKLKKLFIVLISFVIVCSIVTVTYEIIQMYDRNILVLNDQGVDLKLYKPFSDNTKAVLLDEQSSLKIDNDLIVLDGATALYPLYSAFVKAVYPEGDYDILNSEVMCNNTIGAFDNLLKGTVDIIFTAHPSKEHLQVAEDKGLVFNLTPIGKEAFVFFVNSDNPIDGLTKVELQDIYSGKITNWKEVGGMNETIRAFQRMENSGSQTMLQKFMENNELMIPLKKDRIAGMGGIITQTANYKNYKNSIGFSFLYFATEMAENKQIKLLEVDGIYPELNTIRSNQYPLVAEFYAITAGSDNPNIEKFIEWILSPQGQTIIEKTGYTPIR